MESNKEESIRCLEIAESFLESGENEKAEKFAQKSLRLFPSDKAKELVSRIAKNRKTKIDNQNYVQRVLKSDNYYEILGVLKEATNDDMKKSLRKLAKQLHPDKNKVPGAAEAFIKVKHAFEVLSDSEKRRQYDQTSPTGVRYDLHGNRFTSKVTPETFPTSQNSGSKVRPDLPKFNHGPRFSAKVTPETCSTNQRPVL